MDGLWTTNYRACGRKEVAEAGDATILESRVLGNLACTVRRGEVGKGPAMAPRRPPTLRHYPENRRGLSVPTQNGPRVAENTNVKIQSADCFLSSQSPIGNGSPERTYDGDTATTALTTLLQREK